ncbi:MAG: FadR family transcriptional regulator [Chloroflexota bacterium]|nr:FadR family transcriptional regulator [Chloroflexota bacterium]
MTTRPIRSINVPVAVAQAIRERVAQGEWKPGERMPGNRELASMFGVSMGSVREAISLLSAEGLIRSRAGLGTFVVNDPPLPAAPPVAPAVEAKARLYDRNQIEELLEAREILESQIAGLAASRAMPAHIEKMKAIVERMQTGVREPARFSEHDIEFHMTMAEAAGNRVLFEAMANIRAQLKRDMELSAEVGARRFGDLQFSIDSHRRVVEWIEAGDGDRARAEMESIMSRHHRFVLSLYPSDAGEGE